MKNYLLTLTFLIVFSCQPQKSQIADHVTIKVNQYEYQDELRTSIQPQIRKESGLADFDRRFIYILTNIPEIHQPELKNEREKIKALYPDTLEIERQYVNKYANDEKLVGYFQELLNPIQNTNFQSSKNYSMDELMDVASKFFYFWKVNEDTSLVAKVCIGLNGVEEANWKEDRTLLEAFCFEAIFYGIIDNKESKIWNIFSNQKQKASEYHRMNQTSLEQYLENAKTDLFERMKTNETLKGELLAYYKQNKNNLPFKIEN